MVASSLDITAPNKAEERLHENEQWLAAIVNSATDAIISVDEQQRIRLFNPAAEKMFGFRAAEVIGQPLTRLIPERFGGALEDPIRHFPSAGVTARPMGTLVKIRGRRADGEAFPIEASLSQTTVAGAKMFTLILRDITARKRIEEKLRARERQQAAVADLGQRALSCTDLQELLDAATAAIADVLGVEYCKVLEARSRSGNLVLRAGVGWRAGLVGHATVGAGQYSQAGYTLATNEPVIVADLRTEKRFTGPALLLEHNVVSGISCAIAGPKGGPWGVLGAHTRRGRTFTRDDVNFVMAIANVLAAGIERHYFARALREREADLNRAQAVGRIGSWRLDVRRNELTWSAENHRIFGIPQGLEMTYETFLACVHPNDREYVDQMWQRGLRGEPYDIEHRIIVDGEAKWVREKAQLEFDEDGDLLGGFGTAQDITEHKRAEAALREADRRKNEFLATLGHELRNPLAPIRNAVEILKLQDPCDPIVQTARDLIERQLQHMVRLIDDLLDVGRITRGKLQLRRERVALAAVLEQALEAARPHVEDAGHELTVSLPVPPIELDADPVRLAQIFLNLLNNACHFTAKGGRIGLSAKRDGADVVVKVTDTGIGILPEDLARVFDMFSQLDAGLEQSPGGLGIGLSLVRGLVEMHGGRIEARSRGTGQGSTFIVRLPALREAPARPPPAPAYREERMAATARRILVVDDNRDIVKSLALLLELGGNEVATASNGLEAVETAERYRPDVVLLDIGMPKLDGYAVCRRLRQRPWGKDLVIIALTGWGREHDRLQAQAAGFNSHLVKPVDPAALHRLLVEPQAAKA